MRRTVFVLILLKLQPLTTIDKVTVFITRNLHKNSESPQIHLNGVPRYFLRSFTLNVAAWHGRMCLLTSLFNVLMLGMLCVFEQLNYTLTLLQQPIFHVTHTIKIFSLPKLCYIKTSCKNHRIKELTISSLIH